MQEDKTYTLLVNKKRIPVTEEVYKAYYHNKEREIYLDKLSERNNLSYEECEEKGIQIDYLLSQTQESAEDKLIKAEMLSRLSAAMEKLTEQERLLIYTLFFKGKSERELCAMLGIAKTTLHDRKTKILGKLKKILQT
ncbi:RNA polymerase sigma factor [Desulfosporosinus sp. BICA1-9]|uniref:RNA polymerase sigma factor n=1 Tax=Desulfosporosinus sp. BICA1-9 TaxID=1531958 RepID=UPI00054B2734|nr:sigma-70 family RNA polymerase sigma factor [Desulfosporosinus sp. BICA1-9]KJS86669.1 MAG: DNA-directed RNA polymerase subunit beta [Desulfosporosinus sp. BICA1-9]HBV85378.1 sigma-70 family RNA polymerase sigma factor [Desulfosporosinus sp.]